MKIKFNLPEPLKPVNALVVPDAFFNAEPTTMLKHEPDRPYRYLKGRAHAMDLGAQCKLDALRFVRAAVGDVHGIVDYTAGIGIFARLAQSVWPEEPLNLYEVDSELLTCLMNNFDVGFIHRPVYSPWAYFNYWSQDALMLIDLNALTLKRLLEEHKSILNALAYHQYTILTDVACVRVHLNLKVYSELSGYSIFNFKDYIDALDYTLKARVQRRVQAVFKHAHAAYVVVGPTSDGGPIPIKAITAETKPGILEWELNGSR